MEITRDQLERAAELIEQLPKEDQVSYLKRLKERYGGKKVPTTVEAKGVTLRGYKEEEPIPPKDTGETRTVPSPTNLPISVDIGYYPKIEGFLPPEKFEPQYKGGTFDPKATISAPPKKVFSPIARTLTEASPKFRESPLGKAITTLTPEDIFDPKAMAFQPGAVGGVGMAAIVRGELPAAFSHPATKEAAARLEAVLPDSLLAKIKSVQEVPRSVMAKLPGASKDTIGLFEPSRMRISIAQPSKGITKKFWTSEGIPQEYQPYVLNHELAGHFMKSLSTKEEFVAAIDAMKEAGIKADYPLISKHWNEMRYAADKEVKDSAERFAETFEPLSPGEISRTWEVLLNRFREKDRLLNQFNEAKSRIAFEDDLPLSSKLRDHVAIKDSQGNIHTDSNMKSHYQMANHYGLPLQESTAGWYVEGKFYDNNKDALKALYQLGTDTPKAAVQTGRGGFLSLDGIKELYHNMRDKITLQVVPNLTRAGVFQSAVDHASAKYAIQPMSKDMIGRLSIDGVTNPTEQQLEKFANAMRADRILGGHQEFTNMAADRAAAGDLTTAGRWNQQASRIAQKHGLQKLEAIVAEAKQDPTFNTMVKNWKERVEPDLTKLYNEELGFLPEVEREGKGKYFDTYFPLVSKDKEAKWLKWTRDDREPMPEASASHYMNPHLRYDPFTQAAKYTGDYSTNMEIILPNLLSRRYENVTKWRMYKNLVDNGVASWEEVESLGGVATKPMSVKVPEISEKGKSRQVLKTLWVKGDLTNELNRVLNTDYAKQHSKIFTALTDIQLAQMADLVTHTKNLLSVISTAQGAGSVWQDVLRQVPVLGTADGIGRVASVWREVLSDTPAIRAEMADMAKHGLMRPYFPPTGIGAITKSQDFLYRLDSAARIQMNRFFDQLVQMKKVVDTPLNRFNYVTQAGQYNKRLMSDAMRVAKEWGISPFIVAGRNFNRQARRRLFGDPGVEATNNLAAAQMRLIHLAGIGMLGTIPMILNTLTTGKPGGRPGTPIGAWDLGGVPDEKGKFKTLDLLQWTGVRRGMRSIGMEAAVEGLRQGHTGSQIRGKMVTDIVSTASHPWMGPGISGIAHAAPVLSPGMGQYVYGATDQEHLENLRKFLENQNPLLYSVARPGLVELGIDKEPDKPYIKNVAHTTFLKSPFQAFGVKDTAPAQSGAEKEAHDIISGHFHGVMDKSDKEKYQAESALVNDLRRGEGLSDNTRELLTKARDKGLFTSMDVDRIIKKGTVTQLESYLDRLNAKETARVMIAAIQTNNERDKKLILPHLASKLQSADPVTQREVLTRLREAMGK